MVLTFIFPTLTLLLLPLLSGTGSARAALVDVDGNILSESTYNTTTFRSDSDSRIFEQSTTEIWNSISSAIKDVVRDSKVDPKDVKGLGFDATCSLAVVDQEGNPISVTPKEDSANQGFGKGQRNIILWADHRAEEEAKEINQTGNMVLNYVGGTMSVSKKWRERERETFGRLIEGRVEEPFLIDGFGSYC